MKYTLFFVCLFVLSSLFAQKQEAPTKEIKHKNNVIKSNTLELISGVLNVGFEKAISKKNSILISFSRGDLGVVYVEEKYKNPLITEYSLAINALIIAEIRYYISHKNNKMLAGLHVGSQFSYTNVTQTNNVYLRDFGKIDSEKINYIIQTIGVTFGPQILIKRAVAIDFHLGPVYAFVLNSNNVEDVNNSGFGVYLGLSCGYAF